MLVCRLDKRAAVSDSDRGGEGVDRGMGVKAGEILSVDGC